VSYKASIWFSRFFQPCGDVGAISLYPGFRRVYALVFVLFYQGENEVPD